MAETLRIAVSGLNAAIVRVVNVASNVVNVLSTGRLPQRPEEKASCHQPRDVVAISCSAGNNNLGVKISTKPREPFYNTEPAPASSLTDSAGMIAAPNVDLAKELVEAKMAEIAYKANAAVIRAERDKDQDLLNTLA